MSEDLEMKNQFREMFLEEAVALLDDYEARLLSLENSENRAENLAGIFRAAHSIKGSGASVGFTELSSFAHANEDCLAVLRSMPEKADSNIVSLLLASLDIMRDWVAGHKSAGGDFSPPAAAGDMKKLLKIAISSLEGGSLPVPEALKSAATMPVILSKTQGNAASAENPLKQASESGKPAVKAREIPNSKTPAGKAAPKSDKTHSLVKIDSERLDSVMDLVGELVVIKSQILEDESLREPGATRLNSLLALLDKNVRDLYDRTLALRMTPVKGLMLKLERTVRDAALKVNKEVDFLVNGDDCEMDRLLIEKISDPLMHLVRNAVDHGLETTSGRADAGKSLNGKITINVSNRGSGIVFDIEDDGRGIDREKIIAKAHEKSLISDPVAARSLPDSDVFNFLFMSGFSTAEKVTDLSGRGVGLDVVKSNVSALKGTVDILSTFGKGSTFSLRLPLTTAIADGLIVRVATERYIIPLDAVDEVLAMSDVSLTPVANQDACIEIHGKFLPLVNLLTEFNLTGGQQDLVIVLRFGLKTFAVRVDEIIGQSQVVLKNLHDSLAMSRGVAGTAILGDGRVALVMDIGALLPG